jgi:hypothetical protein
VAPQLPRRPRGLKANRPTVRSSSCPARPHGQRHAVVRQSPRPPASAVIGPGYSHARSATTTVLTCRAAFAVSVRSLAAIVLQQGHRLSRSTSRPAMSRVAESVWNEAAAAKRLELRVDIKAVELRTRRGAPVQSRSVSDDHPCARIHTESGSAKCARPTDVRSRGDRPVTRRAWLRRPIASAASTATGSPQLHRARYTSLRRRTIKQSAIASG